MQSLIDNRVHWEDRVKLSVRQSESLGSSLVSKIARAAFAGLAILFLAVCGSLGARAQGTTSAVDGTTMDSTGAAIVDAKVTVTNTATGVNYTATSNNLGVFHVTQLPPGHY